MTRNTMRFLVGSLLSLAPLSALGGPVVDFGFPDLLSQRDEYVSVREGAAIQLPSLRRASAQAVGPALENFFVVNQTGLDIHLGILTLSGTLNGTYSPYPVPTSSAGGFQVSAPTPTVAAPLLQHYYWTVDPAYPGGAKTCLWRVEVSDVGGNCTALVTPSAYGGAVCSLSLGSSGIDPATCAMQLVTYIQ
ncbi:hypothetical protein [Myxococcus qinghaiensis]|uniref:hypothetical protein n=1 Tax=Myxococcus qinghaiensis TaxID=2906758 RepID=UPI0020A7ABAB|nr:hypothetical protein [Myxococcus qinghaiensis]MCP3167753.1 hypothetical protein [Myxococcus qinghaiensis]